MDPLSKIDALSRDGIPVPCRCPGCVGERQRAFEPPPRTEEKK